MRKTAFLFPGQGAQNVGMGRSFYEKYDAVRQYFKTAQEVTGIDVASLCFEENEALNQTEYTQIAMYTTECAILNVLQEKGKRQISPISDRRRTLGEKNTAGKLANSLR